MTPFVHDRTYLRHTFHHTDWQIDGSASLAEAASLLRECSYAIVLCDERLEDGGGWRQLFDEANALPVPPAFIVTSALADDMLWAEVLNLGGYDVLMKPFDRREVARVLSQAWRHWKQRSRRRWHCAPL